MAAFDKFMHNVLTDVEVKLKEHIQDNFRSGSFYGDTWPGKSQYPGAKQKNLYQNGILQEQVDPQANYGEQTITVHSTLPYAAIHNEGGVITVNQNMIRFFWAMYYKARGAVTTKKDGTASKNKRNTTLNAHAEYWKGLALMKVGSKIKIPERRFVGPHPHLDTSIENIVHDNVKEIEQYLANRLKP